MKILCLLFLPLLVTGCLPLAATVKYTHRPHRMNQTPDGDDSIVKRLETGGRGKATVAFLEFDDQGEMWRSPNGPHGWEQRSYTQLPTVLKELDRQESGVKTVIYIHGWKNSAKEGNGNLRNFEHSLKQIAAVSDVPVFGVYVGWRGGVTYQPIQIDVASREAAAARIGGPSMLAALRAISEATHRKGDSSVIAIGHSFGAKILTQVTCNHLAAQIGVKAGSEEGKAQVTPLADTVILANTAENAVLPLQLVNLMRDFKVRFETDTEQRRDLPLVISLCSVHDSATRRLLPVWNNIARNVIGLPNKGGATANKTQDGAVFNAMGFYSPMRSHMLLPRNGKPIDDHPVKWNGGDWSKLLKENRTSGARWPLKDGETFRVNFSGNGMSDSIEEYSVGPIDDKEFYKYKDSKRGNGVARNETPFWFLQLPAFVSSDHNDFWNPNFTGLVVALDSMKAPSSNPEKQGGRLKSVPTPKLMLSAP